MRATLADDILNSLTAHVAVVDSTGVIVAVNEAWKRFAHENACADVGAYAGVNYLETCEAAARRSDDAIAIAALKGLRAVLCGELHSFSLEYPCDSPADKRWFIMRVTPLSSHPDGGIVVAHEDITARKNIETALEVANRELREALAREHRLARTDSLTGLNNRGHFFEFAAGEYAMAQRHGLKLSLVIADIDQFKQINDSHGHQVGDEVLRQVAHIAGEHRRASDVLARYGGEEFILMLPGSDGEHAQVVAERLGQAIATHVVRTATGELRVTISAGVAELETSESLEQLIQRADAALYAAKRAGRNRVVFMPHCDAAADTGSVLTKACTGGSRSDCDPLPRSPHGSCG